MNNQIAQKYVSVDEFINDNDSTNDVANSVITKYKPNYQIKKQPNDQIKKQPNDQVKKQPNYQIKKQPNDQIKKQPNDQIKKQPNYQIKKQPNDQIKKQPNDQIKKQPNYQIKKQPNDQIKKQPNDQVKKQPNDQIKKQPNDQIKKQPNDQIKKQLNDQIKKQPNDQVKKQPNLELNDQSMVFILEDYIELNKDLKFDKTTDYLTHYQMIGSKQMRLSNKKVLDINEEFAIEVNLYIPYIFYLYKNNFLFDNKIIICRGMKPFYYFLPTTQIIEIDRTREHKSSENRYLPINNNAHAKIFDDKYWIPPPYKLYFKNDVFIYDKPILVIHNKYNIEWNNPPINFLSLPVLDKLIFKLQAKYKIIYFRPSLKKCDISKVGFSFDKNTNLELDDFELIEKKYPQVIIFDTLIKNDYNTTKLMIYANCNNFITTQGGNANFSSYFAKKLLIFHKKGSEKSSNAYKGWHLATNPEGPPDIQHSKNYMQLIKMATKMFL